MRTIVNHTPPHRAARFAAVAALSFGLMLPQLPKAQAANTLNLRGVAGTVCTIDVTPDPGNANLNLPITTAGLQTVSVGTVTQNCNFPTGYQLTVTDIGIQCNATPAPLGVGAKLFDGTTHYLAYSVNSINPGPATVTGLLGAACAGQVARDVGTVVTAQNSTIEVVFTGDPLLASGTYTDILTFTMTTH
jgi:hypothetical protein